METKKKMTIFMLICGTGLVFIATEGVEKEKSISIM